MKKLVFSVSEENIEIVLLSKGLNGIVFKKVLLFKPVKKPGGGIPVLDSSENIAEMARLLNENKIKIKNVDITISIEGIITRQIETPYMSRRDLHSYIQNNILQFFTMNTDDFYYDYRIAEIIKGEKKKLSILLVAVPRERLKDITSFIESCKLSISSIDIYPDCITNLLAKRKNSSIAILDGENDRCSITILEKGKIFVYSISIFDYNDENYYSEILDNLNYFLNFYSARHFGEKVENLFIFGNLGRDNKFISQVSNNIDIIIEYGVEQINKGLSAASEDIDVNNYPEVLGTINKGTSTYNKDINFISVVRPAKVKPVDKKLYQAIAAAVVLMAGWVMGGTMYLESTAKRFDTTYLDRNIAEKANITEEIKQVGSEKKEAEIKKKFIEVIKSDEFDYMHIMEELKNGLPGNIVVKSLELNNNKAVIHLRINNNTLDAVKAAIAINKMGIFEEVDINSIKLDDSVNEISFELIMRKTN